MTIFTPYKDPTVSYEGHWHLITCMFEIENYDDLAVKAVTGSYENYIGTLCLVCSRTTFSDFKHKRFFIL